MQDLHDFLSPIKIQEINDDNGFTDGQLAKHIAIFETEIPDISETDIVIVGIGETRGSGTQTGDSYAPDKIRKQLYQLHYWHTDTKIADWGNIKTGATINDSYAALKTVLAEIIGQGKTAIILGGSHDITTAQYLVYKDLKKIVECTCIDAMIDLRGDSTLRCENFLLDMLTSEPNMIRHYNHIGFQSYFVHPRLLETMDKLRFDCFRVGVVKENVEEMEPVIRNAHFGSFDISAIRHSDAPAGSISPNGLSGEEACMLTRYAGLSPSMQSFGIYGYQPQSDQKELTAKQISQMIWYFIDGKSRSKQEVKLEERSGFNEFHISFAELDTMFLQSRKTSRWWMQMPDKKFIPCSYQDYLKASRNEIPERWLRVQERN
jgi:arginase family enzyme